MSDFLMQYIEIMIPVSAVIAIMLLLRPLFDKRYAVKARYYIWLILAVRMLLPFDINPAGISAPVEIPIPDSPVFVQQVHPAPPFSDSDTIPDNVVILPENNTDSTVTRQPARKPVSFIQNISLIDAAIFLWVSVGALLFTFFLWQYLSASHEFRLNSTPDYKARSLLNKIRKELKIKSKLPVYSCPSITSPVIMGIINPRIYIPCFEIEEDLLEMILRHELYHYKRKDILYKFILMVTLCVYWFNPLVWLMNHQAQKDIELSCDDDVIKNKDKNFRGLYSESIMSIAKLGAAKRLAFSTGFTNDKQTLAIRFKNIYNNSIKHAGKPVLCLILALCILSSGLVACTITDSDRSFEIPQQAMDFMQFYCDYRNDDNFFEKDGYDLGFAYLFDKGFLSEKYVHSYDKYGNISSYRLPMEAMMDVYQFIFADKMPVEWWNDIPELHAMSWAADYNYINSPFELTVKEAVKTDRNTFTAVLGRVKDGIPWDDIMFTMERQTAEYIPDDLKQIFSSDQEIWRIKNVDVLEGSWQPSEDMIFEIDSVEDFLLFNEDYNKNGFDRVNYKYILTEDIDFGGMELTPIGSTQVSRGFRAEFDGQGHTLSNFRITYQPESIISAPRYIGLFATITADSNDKFGTVKNLIITGAEIKPTSNTADSNVGGVGILAGSTNGATITNCHVSGIVDGHATVGGLIGSAGSANISDCSATAQVSGHLYAGVFAGSIYSSYIYNCCATGTTTGYREDNPVNDPYAFNSPGSIGGFASDIIQSDLVNCHSDVSLRIMDNARIVGAFSSSGQSSKFIGCTYNPAKAGNWEIVDYYHEGYDGVQKPFDITASSGTGNYVDYSDSLQ